MRLLLILVLTISFQTFTKADGIMDFEIEGISVGDSLLDHFKETEITDRINFYKNNRFIFGEDKKAFYALTFKLPELYEKYDGLQIVLKTNDNKYIIYALVGEIYHRDINECYNKFDNIEDIFDSLFTNSNKAEKLKRPHAYDKTGNSYTTDVYYNMDNGDVVAIVCTDWSIEMKLSDSFRVELITEEYADWLKNVVYK